MRITPLPLCMQAVLATFVAMLMCLNSASATIVRYDTVLGTFDVRMYDSLMPISVTNFLSYTNSDRYDGSFVHRSVPGFVIQGGGFTYDPDTNSAPGLLLDPPIDDEPGGGVAGPSNVRGTIAMAKSGPDTVTSQWFFNLNDNSFLDDPARPDGGFSAFGRVLGNGMDVVDAIAALPIYDLDPPPSSLFNNVPLRSVAGGLGDRLVFMNSISVLDVPEGDYNFDGMVDGLDFLVWQKTLGSTTNAAADGNGNGIVDIADFTIWELAMTPSFAAASAFIIPEPTTLTLTLLGCLLSFRYRRNSSERSELMS